MMNHTFNWAILGTGVVANEMARAFKNTGREVYAVANRTYEKAVQFAGTYGIQKIYPTIDAMFEDPAVDIIYITTPHNTHIRFIKKALAAGKHVLCEKAITLNAEELAEALELAEKNNCVLAEAMTLYHMPLYQELKALMLSGELGPLQMIQMNFGSYKAYDMTNRFFNKDLAGGALLDIGVYAISLIRYFMSEKPDQILSQVKYAPTGVDEQAGILLMNSRGEMATIALTLHGKQPKRATVVFEKGYIEIMDYPRAEAATVVFTETGEVRRIEAGHQDRALQYEMEDMEAAVLGQRDKICLEYTCDVMAMMTKIRKDWGMFYNEEI